MKKSEIICIDGTVGIGKSTLAAYMSERTGFPVFEEPVVNNPFLPIYYDNISRWSFATQIYFLNERFKMIKEAETKFEGRPVIMDRSIYGDEIFARYLNHRGEMTDLEYETYHNLLDNMLEHVANPKVMIHIKTDSIERVKKNIVKRGRDYELGVDIGYWKGLMEQYHEYFKTYTRSPLIEYDVTDIDFVDSSDDRESLISSICEEIGNL